MYKINGFNLHDPERGWTVLDSSEWTTGTAINRPALSSPGVDGGVPLPGYQETPSLGLVIGTKYSKLNALKIIMGQQELTLEKAGTPGRALVQLNSMTEDRATGGADPEMEVSIALTIPGVWMRGPEEIFNAVPWVETPEVPEVEIPKPELVQDEPFDVFPGLTGKVTDAVLRLTGVENPKVTDSAGSFIAYKGAVAAGTFLLLDCATGRGWTTTTTSWTRSLEEVNPVLIQSGRGPAFLTITPYLGEDPETPVGRLTITWSKSLGAPGAELKGRCAYIV